MQQNNMTFSPPPLHSYIRLQHKLRSTSSLKRLHASLPCTPPPSSHVRPRSPTRRRDVIKRKVALFVGYDGADYHGIQRQKQDNVNTISDVFEQALHRAGAISDENVGHLEKIKWQVSARTDRGVSAAGNLISAKLLFPRDEHEQGCALEKTTQRVNECLPDSVRIFGIRQITGSFSARSSCDERWYEYLLPTDALHNGRSRLGAFSRTLAKYEGAHSFHNFTVGVDHCVPPRAQAMRYVKHARCDAETFRLEGAEGGPSEWVRIRVHGQSFMLHQIRKMVSLALLVHNGTVREDAIEVALRRGTLINVPPAPATGLFLDACRFTWYNEKQADALAQPISMDSFDSTRQLFKTRYILPSIARKAQSDDALGIYFRTVQAHPVQF